MLGGRAFAFGACKELCRDLAELDGADAAGLLVPPAARSTGLRHLDGVGFDGHVLAVVVVVRRYGRIVDDLVATREHVLADDGTLRKALVEHLNGAAGRVGLAATLDHGGFGRTRERALAVGPEVLDVVETFGRPAAHGIKHAVVVRHDPVDVGKLSVARSGNGLGNRHGVRGQGNGETERERHE